MPESYTGDEGTDALAAGLDVMDGAEKWAGVNGGWRAINKTRDMIAWALNQAKAYADGLFNSISLSWGSITGKPATFPPSGHTHDTSNVTSGGNNLSQRLWIHTGDTTLRNAGDTAQLWLSGNTVFTNQPFLLPSSTAATSGYTIAYINGDGRVSRGASSARFKSEIEAVDPLALGDVFPQLHSFVLDNDPSHTPRLGYIAEDLDANGDLRRFVVYEEAPVVDEDGNVIGTELARDDEGNAVPLSIDFIALLIAQNAQLALRVQALEGALEADR